MTTCPKCQREVSIGADFCPFCGARLHPAPASAVYPKGWSETPLPEQPTRSRSRVAAAIVIIAMLVGLSVLVVALPYASQTPAINIAPASCPPTPTSPNVVSAPTPNYDVQEVMAFTQSYSQLQVNVTAVAQCDVNGYGPSYLLNGLTNTGYWFQVGINWNWPLQSGGYVSGFGFVSEQWAPGGVTRSPPSAEFSGTVNQGDVISLSLSFSGGEVVASALDLNTSATGSMHYPARSASEFVGSQAQQSQSRFSFATQGYFTGLMTEWYHVTSRGNAQGQKVTYSEGGAEITSATLGVGEWNFTTSSPGSVFSAVANNGNPVDFGARPNTLQQFTLNGYSMAADSHEFTTGS